MKLSNILIVSLLAVTLLFVVGSNLVLKAEYEKIDQNDLYYGYKKEGLQPFHFVKVNGTQVGVTQIQSGPDFEIRYSIDRKTIKWKLNGDTLILTHNAILQDNYAPFYDFDSKPAVYIMAPKLSGFEGVKTINILKGWKSDSLKIDQVGQSLMLSESSIEDFSARLTSGAYLLIKSKNKIGASYVNLKDSSQLTADNNIFKSFSLSADSLAKIKLPGSLYNKLSL